MSGQSLAWTKMLNFINIKINLSLSFVTVPYERIGKSQEVKIMAHIYIYKKTNNKKHTKPNTRTHRGLEEILVVYLTLAPGGPSLPGEPGLPGTPWRKYKYSYLNHQTLSPLWQYYTVKCIKRLNWYFKLFSNSNNIYCYLAGILLCIFLPLKYYYFRFVPQRSWLQISDIWRIKSS